MRKLVASVAAAVLLTLASGCVGQVLRPSSPSDGSAGPGTDAGAAAGDGGDAGPLSGGDTFSASGLLVSPYKDALIHLDWNTNVVSTIVSGTRTELASELAAVGARSVTLAFATGECGSETWGGVPGAAMASVNVPLLEHAGIDFIVSTGGAAGTFSCASDLGFEAFLGRWASPRLVGVDLDIEAGQSANVILDLVRRVQAAHAKHPGLRFSLTLATLANNDGATVATSLGSTIGSSFNVYGDTTLAAVRDVLGFDGTAATWPSYLVVNLMTMDYGAPAPGVCVVCDGACDMGQSALQAAYNLHDHFGVPWAGIALTPMIGGNDVQDEHFTLADVDTVVAFAITQRLAAVHYWSFNRDVDCPPGPSTPGPRQADSSFT